MVFLIPSSFAETTNVSIPEGTSLRGCETNNECYLPYQITIDVGDEVTWTNDDLAFHTVTSGNSLEGTDGFFDSGMFKIDEQFSHTFKDSGNFEYFCTLHPWMEGIVIVQELSDEDGSNSEGGGCLIATATFGSELAPQVQQLREIRDKKLQQTDSGSTFIQEFNKIYYSFSPIIADFERENLVFKQAIKITLTPMLVSLSLLNYVNLDSEYDVIGYGVSLILLNVGMYLGLPAFVFFRIKKKFEN